MSNHKQGLEVGRVVFGDRVVRGASPAQVRFIDALLAQREFNPAELDGVDLSHGGAGVNLRHASRVIDYLKSCPMRADAPAVPASEKQVAFARTLIEKRVTGDQFAHIDLTKASREVIGDIIGKLVDQPIKESTLELGAYRHDGVVYSVRKNNDNNRRYAVHWVTNLDGSVSWSERDYKIVYKIKDSERLSLKEAMEWGAQTGSCCHCGRRLTDPTSVATGIGAICAKKYR